MRNEEQLKWINDNRIHGEVAIAVKNLNPNEVPDHISLSEAYAIINGNLWGTHGDTFCNEMERIIRERLRLLEKSKKKYAKTA